MKHRASIHKRVILRLLIAWLALSVVIGAAVSYFEIRKAEALVLQLAIAESRTFAAANLYHFNRPGAAHEVALRRQAEQLLRQRFILVRLYDRDQHRILQVAARGANPAEVLLQQHRHLLRPAQTAQHNAAFFRQRLLMHILLPLKQLDDTPVGYFEGVYQVDPQTLARIRSDLLGALSLVVLVTLAAAVALYPVIISLNRELIKFSADLLKGNISLMEVLGTAIAMRDSDTGAHNYRVTVYATRLGETIGLTPPQLRKLIAGAFLHDVGKIGISDAVLLKPGRHSADELRVMRGHVALGVDILRKSEWLKNARDVVEFHHERYDGSGYLRGLKGEQIPLNARIFAIADVFDALVSKRPYKEPWPFDEALRLLERERGKHFDPVLLDAFVAIAHTVYTQINGADEATMAHLLDDLVKKYFFD
jgi:HD-GYP domain-containing protein (c-di-GMP phosphodiesterase class II)